MGTVSATVAKIPRDGKVPAQQISLIWFPAYQGLWANEKAHETVRDLTCRSIAADSPSSRRESLPSGDELRTLQEIISRYKLGLKTYAAADKQLSKKRGSHVDESANRGISISYTALGSVES
ncbi:hypothetical protein HPB48_003455 [Haemaphysalis longicornis]|uniref:Uncharacterized protein n=1 Tax=Haemaphysalis longicornis TaxID=44386 RepID=A0A9J6GFE0_HAELO|nr:hypothetical protein HPB48_003455 [Haemaphysalis longicornis]